MLSRFDIIKIPLLSPALSRRGTQFLLENTDKILLRWILWGIIQSNKNIFSGIKNDNKTENTG
jgi:hypothetical protein